MVTIPKPNKIEVEKYLDKWDSLLAVFKQKMSLIKNVKYNTYSCYSGTK